MIEHVVILVLGLIGLCVGADFLIKGSKNIADYFGWSQFFVGLVLISVGTSIPEIAVSIAGGLDVLSGVDASGIVVGETIGSALNQISIILGLLAFLVPLTLKKKDILRQGAALLGSIFLVFGLSADGYLSRFDGAIAIIAYCCYVGYLVHTHEVLKPGPKSGMKIWKNIFITIGGLLIVIYTSNVVVTNGITLAEYFNVSQSLIGILLIGLGTGLPEFTVALFALKRKSMEMSMGNLLGSNICDLLFSLGAGTVIAGFSVDPVNLWFDLPALFLISCIVIYFFYSGRRISKKEGTFLIITFLTYCLLKIFVTG